MHKSNAGKKRKKRKVIKSMAVILVIFAIGFIVSGIELNDIEHAVRKIKDEVIVYAYNPSLSNDIAYEQYVVCIDAGHGGKDPGTMSGDRLEKDDNLRLALKVKQELEKSGVLVLLTREDDTFISLKKRAKIANENDADLFVSLHRNCLEGYSEVNGVDIYINCEEGENDYKIGNALKEELERVGGMKINELKPGSATDANENYIVVAKTKMTACLIEMGYMSNTEDNRYFDDSINSYAIAITEGILNYLEK